MTSRDVVRDVTDAGIRLRATIPSDWSELRVEGVALVVSGKLDDNDQTLTPALQIRVQHAAGSASVEEAVRGAATELPEAVVIFQRSGVDRAGYPETVAEVAHRNELTGATQVSMFRAIALESKKLAVVAVGTCGGAASEEARDALRAIVSSVTVGPAPAV